MKKKIEVINETLTIVVSTVMSIITGVITIRNQTASTLIILAILNLLVQCVLLLLRQLFVRMIIHKNGFSLLKEEPHDNRNYFFSSLLPNITSLFEDTTPPSSKVLALSSIRKWYESVDFILSQLVDGNHFDLKQVTEYDSQYRDDKLHEYDIVNISAALVQYGRNTILSKNGLVEIAYSSLPSVKKDKIINQYTQYCNQLADLPSVREELAKN